MGRIFISYRRSDSEGQAGRLARDLGEVFGRESILLDVAALTKGRDFRLVIDEQLNSCSIVLVVIGKSWVNASDAKGTRRLDDLRDVVRGEVLTALRRDLPVIPVLVGGATMPSEVELPDDIKDLVYRDGVELTHARWDYDVKALVDALSPLMPEKPRRRRLTGATKWAFASLLVVGAAGLVAYKLIWLPPPEGTDRAAQAPATVAGQENRLATPIDNQNKVSLEISQNPPSAAAKGAALGVKPQAIVRERSTISSDNSGQTAPVPQSASSTLTPAPSSVAGAAATHAPAPAPVLLTAVAKEKLTEFSRYFEGGKPIGLLKIMGHAAIMEDSAESERLSRARAQAVRQHLITLGVSEDIIRVEALGAKKPLTRDMESQSRNNRVELEAVINSASGQLSNSSYQLTILF